MAKTERSLSDMTVAALKEVATRKKLPFTAKTKKAELVAMIEASKNGSKTTKTPKPGEY
jgi:antitoxin component of RelBE/YafQ-DinJ toxin-antitoxin module